MLTLFIGQLGHVHFGVVSVVDAIDGATAKLHHILGQGASFVAEYILDLAKVFGDVEGTTFESLSVACVHIVLIHINRVEYLENFDKFHTNVKRNWNDHLVQNGKHKKVHKNFKIGHEKILLIFFNHKWNLVLVDG